jgi:transcriptional regulator with XRE-family HTH domain
VAVDKLGDYIRTARERRGWSLREAAKRTGIPHSRLFELESGKSSKTGKPVVPTKSNLEALAMGYGLPIDNLFALAHFPGYLKSKEGLTGTDLSVLDLYRSLSPARQSLWVSIGEGLKNLPPEKI